MSATTPKTVELYGEGQQHEAKALGDITPGMLVERAAGGVQAHSTAGGPANPHFANEFGFTGGEIGDDYATDDQVVFTTYVPGSGVYAIVAAGAAAITEGDLLASAGDGTLAAAGNSEVAVAQALEDVDNSGGSSAVRIQVETVSPQRTNAA